jgi:ABC-type nickel/cobalt efflux system permease component RcnA
LSTWSSSQVAVGVAGVALVIALASWVFIWRAIWRERARRSQRVKEAVFEWAGNSATKADLDELRRLVVELSTQSSAEVTELRRVVVELADRLTSLEAEPLPRAESDIGRFPRR